MTSWPMTPWGIVFRDVNVIRFAFAHRRRWNLRWTRRLLHHHLATAVAPLLWDDDDEP